MELKSGRLATMAAIAAGMAGDWVAVPDDLERFAHAKMLLAASSGTAPRVNMRSTHPLAKWGRDKRKEKRKAKIAAASRRRNRNGKR